MLTVKYTIIFFLFLWSAPLLAQPYTEKKTQHRFAQSYLGINLQTIPSSGLLLWDQQEMAFPNLSIPRLTIGGLHFWGKLDFNINIPLTTLGDQSLSEEDNFWLTSGGDLSARYYPWRMKYNFIRPYVGYSANEMKFGINSKSEGNRQDIFITSSLITGISFARNDWQINIENMWLPYNTRGFYSNRSNGYNLKLPKNYVSVGIIKYFEGTIREEKDFYSGRIFELEDQLRKENKLNSFSVGIAPSGAYFLLAPGNNDEIRRSLPRHKANFVWEFSVGYLFHDAGIHLGFSYRDYTSTSESYGLEQLIRRKSVAFEALKFMGNYNGFVPFIGPSISYERWANAEFEDDIQLNFTQRNSFISPGIIFGWDILASPLEVWVLRTNLRYYPFQRISAPDGSKSRVDQFEFNFIQLVIYPNRWVHVSKAKRNR